MSEQIVPTMTQYRELEAKLLKAWADTVKEKLWADDALYVLRELNARVHGGYDFNADPDKITAMVGTVLSGGLLPQHQPPRR